VLGRERAPRRPDSCLLRIATKGVRVLARVASRLTPGARLYCGKEDCITAEGRILVVDDDPSIRDLLTELLARAGYETVAASSGEEALALAREAAPSLVVLDVNLPGTNGYTVCNELRHSMGRRLPIMFLSGDRTESFDRVAGLLIGADDYVAKPFDPDELIARVERMLERADQWRTRPSDDDPYGLTPREREVLSLLLDGLSQPEIAERLVLSPKTVGTHIQRIIGKMGVRSRTQAVALAVRERTLV
jgi:DNA-binding NarL/FixJ family response regulator